MAWAGHESAKDKGKDKGNGNGGKDKSKVNKGGKKGRQSGAKWSNGAVSNAFPGEQGGLRHFTGTIGPVITLIDLCHVMSYMVWLDVVALHYHIPAWQLSRMIKDISLEYRG